MFTDPKHAGLALDLARQELTSSGVSSFLLHMLRNFTLIYKSELTQAFSITCFLKFAIYQSVYLSYQL